MEDNEDDEERTEIMRRGEKRTEIMRRRGEKRTGEHDEKTKRARGRRARLVEITEIRAASAPTTSTFWRRPRIGNHRNPSSACPNSFEISVSSPPRADLQSETPCELLRLFLCVNCCAYSPV